jgi:mRNA interferase RelE/StbE
LVFKVLLHPIVAKALKKIDDTNRTRMKKALGDLASDPWKVGKPLHPSHFWGLRSEDYRAIYEIDVDQKRIIVVSMGHRKNVYDDFSKMI